MDGTLPMGLSGKARSSKIRIWNNKWNEGCMDFGNMKRRTLLGSSLTRGRTQKHYILEVSLVYASKTSTDKIKTVYKRSKNDDGLQSV